MSFFGFDASLPRQQGHNSQAPGFGPTQDVFAGLSQRNEDDDEGMNFDDMDDGLGNNLDEDNDAFNDATFGAGPVDTNFDFSGQGRFQSSRPEPAQPEQPSQFARAPPQQTSRSSGVLPGFVRASDHPQAPPKPARTGYERYGSKGQISNLEADAAIWGTKPTATPVNAPRQSMHSPQPSGAAAGIAAARKMMSLEEVEAQMRSQQRPSPQPGPTFNPPQAPAPSAMPAQQPIMAPHARVDSYSRPQALQSMGQSSISPQPQLEREMPRGPAQQPVQSDQHNGGPLTQANLRGPAPMEPQPMQPIQGHSRAPSGPAAPARGGFHGRGPSMGGQPMPHPSQMSEKDRAAFIQEDAKRAKRNHKIHLLSKDNGLMTPQDKNFITRIQLQQLLTATGTADEPGHNPDINEDFYYHVLSRIRGEPNQSSDRFSQTYMQQLAYRGGNQRYRRGGENHMRRLEQQVARAVEAAKNRPKNKQLVVEGSLGKISFSNAKTPKPLLNIKRNESQDITSQQNAQRPKTAVSASGYRAQLKDIERVYSTLMNMEDHERGMPPPATEESSADEIQNQMEWRARIGELNNRLWVDLKMTVPIESNSTTLHPFIGILSHSKGKKLLPRVFRQINDEQRTTILTMIAVHLGHLDVVKSAQPAPSGAPLPRQISDEVELFSQAVMPTLFAYVSEAPLAIVIGLLGLVLDRITSVQDVVRTKIGIGFLTMFVSRAEIIKQSGQGLSDEDWQQWSHLYNRLFDNIEPQLPLIFPFSIEAGDDVYVWQFLAAIGIGANADQQQRLVIGVKDRVMDTVNGAKDLPDDVAKPRLDNVNLFMKAIGLDVSLLG